MTAENWLLQTASGLLGVPKDALDDAESRSSIANFCAGGASTLLVYAVEKGPAIPSAERSGSQAEPAAVPPAGEPAVQPEGAATAMEPSESTGTPPVDQGSPGEPTSEPADAADAPAEACAAPSTEPLALQPDDATPNATAGEERAPAPPLPPMPPLKPELRVVTSSLPPAHQACPTVYFLRRGAAMPVQPLVADNIEAQLSYGLLPFGPSLGSLHQLLASVFIPWLGTKQEALQDDDGAVCAAATSTSGSSAPCCPAGKLDDLLAAARKFVGQAEQAVKQLGPEVELPLLLDVDLSQPKVAAASEEAVLVCERCMVEWAATISSTLHKEGAKAPQGRGPLVELHHWQRRAAVYSSLHEQLQAPAVQAAVEVVTLGSLDTGLLASFHSQASDLARLTLEAGDNVKFLLTLERHFTAIQGGSLQAVADALLPMMNAVRMIWIISRYYGDDVRMSNLLERIAHGLQDRLHAAIDVGALFRAPSAQAIQLVSTCRAIAQGWAGAYMAMRERIEASGHHARWEFSRGLLFEATNYADEVCGELLGMLQAVDDFRQFLGPELKAVTGDTSVIDEVNVMLQAMIQPVESASFNVLDKVHATDWRALRSRFARDADDIKLATRDLIDTCFRKLRSVEAAVALLHSFRNIRVAGAIQGQMQDKLADVLEHFLKEIEATYRAFKEGRDAPPLPRNMPPVAGSIKWARSLFARVKHTMAQLQALEGGDLVGLEVGKRASAAYLDLARAMLDYEKARFRGWAATVEDVVQPALQQPLLRRAEPAASALDGSGSVGTSAATEPQEVEEPFVINLSPALLQLLREARFLDSLGFAVPPLAVSVALQEGRLRSQVEGLTGLLKHRRAAVTALTSAERALLGDQLARLDAALAPGLQRLNWVSLAVPEFVGAATKAIEQFQALSAQVKKHSLQIEKVVRSIARAQLMPTPPPSEAAQSAGGGQASTGGSASVRVCSTAAAGAEGEPAAPAVAGSEEVAAEGAGAAGEPGVPSLQEFYEECEAARLAVVEGLVAKYRQIPALLLKVEEAVVGTSTGKAAKLAPYAVYWERRIFAALNELVLRGMDTFQARLKASSTPGSGVTTRPLLRVTLELLAPEAVVSPSMGEVSKQLSRLMRNIVDSAKAFVRWMDGTCLEAPEQFIYGEDSEPFVFSFFSDVSTSPAIIKSMLAANHAVQRTAAAVGRHVEGWRQYAVVWRSDRQGLLNRLVVRPLPAAALGDRMAQYRRLGEEVWGAAGDLDIGFVRVAPAPLAAAIRRECGEWIAGLAAVGRAADEPALDALRGRAAALRVALTESEPGGKEAAAAATAVLTGAAEAETELLHLLQHAEARGQFCGVGAGAPAHQADLVALAAVRQAWQELATVATAHMQAPAQEHDDASVEQAVAAGAEPAAADAAEEEAVPGADAEQAPCTAGVEQAVPPAGAAGAEAAGSSSAANSRVPSARSTSSRAPSAAAAASGTRAPSAGARSTASRAPSAAARNGSGK